MNDLQCRSCKHYLQHYILYDGKLCRIYCGHCKLSHIKRKRPDAHACEQFVQGTDDEAMFASKEYLSKILLERVLTMDLLPEIEEMPVSSRKRTGRG